MSQYSSRSDDSPSETIFDILQSLLKASPQSAPGKAVGYCLNQRSKRIVFFEDGRLAGGNNRAERAVKPCVIGRKSRLFANASGGAQSSAISYSVAESAKQNGPDYAATRVIEDTRPPK